MLGFVLLRLIYFLAALAIIAAFVADHLGIPTPW